MEQGLHIEVVCHGCVCTVRNLGRRPVSVKRLFGVGAL
jgi:hypothetical protein